MSIINRTLCAGVPMSKLTNTCPNVAPSSAAGARSSGIVVSVQACCCEEDPEGGPGGGPEGGPEGACVCEAHKPHVDWHWSDTRPLGKLSEHW